jgi:hypothetical protein
LHSCDDKIPHLFSLVKRFYVDFYIFVKITPTFFVVICRAAFTRNAFACQPLEISFGIFILNRDGARPTCSPRRAQTRLAKQQPLQIAPPQNGFNALQNFFGKMHAIVCLFFLRLL